MMSAKIMDKHPTKNSGIHHEIYYYGNAPPPFRANAYSLPDTYHVAARITVSSKRDERIRR